MNAFNSDSEYLLLGALNKTQLYKQKSGGWEYKNIWGFIHGNCNNVTSGVYPTIYIH